MTREEATEEILKGPFCNCPVCKGSGSVTIGYRTTALRPLSEVRAERTVEYCVPVISFCDQCDNQGKLVRLRYLDACRVTGLPLPKCGEKYLIVERDQ